jgi:tetratricopeptide (TPR) repeat protein
MSHIKSLEKSAWKYFSANNYLKSEEVFEKIQKEDSHNIAAYQGRIACHRKLNDFKNAGAILEEALTMFPYEPGILSEKAWFYLEQNDYENAIKAFEELLLIKKDDIGLYLWYLYLLRNQEHFEKINATLKNAKLLFPDNISLLVEEGWMLFYLSKIKESDSVFSSILARNPSHEIALQGKIACLRMQRKFDEALRMAENAYSLIGESPGIYSEKGWLNIELENYQEAEENFRNVLRLVKNDSYANINLAWALIKQGSDNDLDEATTHCIEALNINKNLAQAWSCLGNIAFKRGNIREAENCFLQSIEAEPRKGAYCDLGALYLQMERFDEAKEKIEAALNLNANDAYARLEMGYLYFGTNKIKDAIREFRRATTLDIYNPEPFRALGIALMEDNNVMEAEKVLRSAINKFDARHCNGFHIALTQLLIKAGDQASNSIYYEDALKEILLAIRIKPDNPSNHFYNGIVRFKMENYQSALACFKQCLRYDKHFIEAELNVKRINEILQKNKSLVKSSKLPSFFLTIIFLSQLVLVWVLYLKTGKINTAVISVLVPILSGLLVISILLPWLSKFKMSGIEAELTSRNPKDSLASGPKGEMVLVTTLSKPY